MAGASILRGADSTCNPLQMGEPVSPWIRHQERTHKLSAYAKQPPVGSHYVGEGIDTLLHGLSLAMRKPLMTIISLVSELSLTMAHVNLV